MLVAAWSVASAGLRGENRKQQRRLWDTHNTHTNTHTQTHTPSWLMTCALAKLFITNAGAINSMHASSVPASFPLLMGFKYSAVFWRSPTNCVRWIIKARQKPTLNGIGPVAFGIFAKQNWHERVRKYSAPPSLFCSGTALCLIEFRAASSSYRTLFAPLSR